MRKIKIWIEYPWAGIPDDEEIIEIEDNATKKEIDDIFDEVTNEMLWNRLSAGYEEIE